MKTHAGGWSRVLGDEKLRSDGIHANVAGYRAFAQGLAAPVLERLVWRDRPGPIELLRRA